jgi:hypothetical protein
MSLIDQLRQADAAAKRANQRPTHWRLSPNAYDQLRSETRDAWSLGSIDEPEFLGFPIYRDPEVESWLLCEGLVPDPARERELRRQLSEIQRAYYKLSEPIVKELVEIENRKPPKPIIIDAATLELLAKR